MADNNDGITIDYTKLFVLSFTAGVLLFFLFFINLYSFNLLGLLSIYFSIVMLITVYVKT